MKLEKYARKPRRASLHCDQVRLRTLLSRFHTTKTHFGPGLGEVIAMQHCYRLALRREETPTRAREMNPYSRRQVLAGAAAATMLGTPSVRSQTNQQTLRFIAEADLKVLDPIWTT